MRCLDLNRIAMQRDGIWQYIIIYCSLSQTYVSGREWLSCQIKIQRPMPLWMALHAGPPQSMGQRWPLGVLRVEKCVCEDSIGV